MQCAQEPIARPVPGGTGGTLVTIAERVSETVATDGSHQGISYDVQFVDVFKVLGKR